MPYPGPNVARAIVMLVLLAVSASAYALLAQCAATRIAEALGFSLPELSDGVAK